MGGDLAGSEAGLGWGADVTLYKKISSSNFHGVEWSHSYKPLAFYQKFPWLALFTPNLIFGNFSNAHAFDSRFDLFFFGPSSHFHSHVLQLLLLAFLVHTMLLHSIACIASWNRPTAVTVH
jgi:hypothetical protein